MFYFQERMVLIQTIESLLSLGEGASCEGTYMTVIEETLHSLVNGSNSNGEASTTTQNIEETTLHSLKDNLQRRRNQTDAVFTDLSSIMFVREPHVMTSRFAHTMNQRQIPFGMTYEVEERWLQDNQSSMERNILLNILILMYFHPRKQCTPERFLELARLFRACLYSVPLTGRNGFQSSTPGSTSSTMPRDTNGDSDADGQHRSSLLIDEVSLQLSVLLLMELLVLDVDKLLCAFAEGSALTQDENPFLRPDILDSLNQELQLWWKISGHPHPAVVLVWSALLTLAHAPRAQDHAVHAAHSSALSSLAKLSSMDGISETTAVVACTVLFSAVSAIVTAFRLEASCMSSQDLDDMVTVLRNAFRGDALLCEQFHSIMHSAASGDRFDDHDHDLQQQRMNNNGVETTLKYMPVYSFIAGLSSLFPAQHTHMLQLLASMCCTDVARSAAKQKSTVAAAAAAAINLHVARVSQLVCLHRLPDAAIVARSSEDPSLVVTDQQLALPGCPSIFIPQGVVGEVLEDPPGGLFPAVLWTAAQHPQHTETLRLIRWRYALPESAAHTILLCRAFHAIEVVRTTLSQHQQGWQGKRSGGINDATIKERQDINVVLIGALVEAESMLCLLSAMCNANAAVALELLNVEAPISEDASSEGVRGPDLLVLASQTLGTLALTSKSRLHSRQTLRTACTVAKHCFSVLTAFAQSAPGRVLEELMGALDIKPLSIALSRDKLAGSAIATSGLPILHSLVETEQKVHGRFFVLQSLLELLIVLLRTAVPSQGLAILVGYVLQHVMPALHRWQYPSPSPHFWELATSCISLVRYALLCPSDAPVAVVTAEIINSPVGMSSCLFPLLPPHATVAELMSTNAAALGEAVAIEQCCIAWLRLVPVLLPAGDAAAALSPLSFFRPLQTSASTLLTPMSAGVTPANVLLSYFLYPFFDSHSRGLVMKALHCFLVTGAMEATGISIGSLLPQENNTLDARVKTLFAKSLSDTTVKVCRELFGATCDVLVAACHFDPTLIDALMFPSVLTEHGARSDATKEGVTALVVAGDKKTGTVSHRQGLHLSCLDSLWNLLLHYSKHLYREDNNNNGDHHTEDSPARRPPVKYAFAKVMHVLSALWCSGGSSSNAVSLLQQQDGFWDIITNVITHAASYKNHTKQDAMLKELLCHYSPDATDGNRIFNFSATWLCMNDTCWQIAAETHVITVLVAEVFTWVSSLWQSPSSSSKDSLLRAMPRKVKALASDGIFRAIPCLLERYCSLLPSMSYLDDCSRVAAASGMHLVACSLHDSIAWPTLHAAPSITASCAAALNSELASCQTASEGVCALNAGVNGILSDAALFHQRPSIGAVADVVLASALVPGRLSSEKDYGRDFLYDAQIFSRKIPHAAYEDTSLLADTQEWMAGASMALSLEYSRSAAAVAVNALITVAISGDAFASSKCDSIGTDGSSIPSDSIALECIALLKSSVAMLNIETEHVAMRHPSVFSPQSCDDGSSMVQNAAVEDVLMTHLSGLAMASYSTLLMAQNSGVAVSHNVCRGSMDLLTAWLGVVTNDGSFWMTPGKTHGTSGDGAGDRYGMDHTAEKSKSSSNSMKNQPNGGDKDQQRNRHFARVVHDVTRYILANALHSVAKMTEHAGESRPQHQVQETVVVAQQLFVKLISVMSTSFAAGARHAAISSIVDEEEEKMENLVQTISLAAILIEKILPTSIWLPCLEQHLNVAHAMALSMDDLARHRSGAVQVADALFILLLQVSQTQEGASLLVMHGIPGMLIPLCQWLGSSVLYNEEEHDDTQGGGTAAAAAYFDRRGSSEASSLKSLHGFITRDIDHGRTTAVSIAPTTGGTPTSLWRAALSFLGGLLSSIPAHPVVRSTALDVAILMDARLQHAVCSPDAFSERPLTLSATQETKYSLFLLCSIAASGGQWRLSLPHALPAFRRATAALLNALAMPVKSLACAPTTGQERGLVSMPCPLLRYCSAGGWFEACSASAEAFITKQRGAHGDDDLDQAVALSSKPSPCMNEFGWSIADRLYGIIQYALTFQLITAPEITEAEVSTLGSEWIDAGTLRTLQSSCADVLISLCDGDVSDSLEGCQGSVKRAMSTLIAILKLSSRLLDMLSYKASGCVVHVELAMKRAEAIVKKK